MHQRIGLQVARITNNSEVLEAWDLETWGTGIVPGGGLGPPLEDGRISQAWYCVQSPGVFGGWRSRVTGENRKADKNHSFQEAVTILSYTWRLNP